MNLAGSRAKLRALLVVTLAVLPGIATAQQSFAPVTPCRVVDTRGSDDWNTGVLEPGVRRGFKLSVDFLDWGQGGPAPCAGLPERDERHLVTYAVNITVTGFTGNGALKAWGGRRAEPQASVINYSTGHVPSVANNAIIQGCLVESFGGCDYYSHDIIVEAIGSPTHVLIDVVGYFK